MLRRPSENGIAQAARRPLKIFASDPLLGRTFGNRARIDIVNEPLQEGPIGSRLEVLITTEPRIVSTRLSISIWPQF